jgi:transposase
VSGLNVRIWMCGECGDIHHRDVNAAKNILFAGRCPPSVSVRERERVPGVSGGAEPAIQAMRG